MLTDGTMKFALRVALNSMSKAEQSKTLETINDVGYAILDNDKQKIEIILEQNNLPPALATKVLMMLNVQNNE